MLTSEREQWQRVKAVFQTLAERPESEWELALGEMAVTDPALAGEVRALLDAHCEGGDVLSGVVAAALRQEAERLIPANPGPERAGRRAGAYRLLRSLGQGGMGEVWLAERADDAFHKQVAVKLVRMGRIVAAEAFERFRTEREALARLEHPNIVRILDAGTDEDGVPFFVMEYVQGEPIERYCEARALPLAERLRLFLQVCAAVEHAHHSLIVHRDIKPGNVLVTADGTVKLLDFGIAKLLDPEPGSFMLTRTAFTPATPAFASPEQLAGAPVTTATDVYALGILLYRLITGRHPYALATEHLAEVARVIRDTPPSRPSQAVSLTLPGATTESGLPLPSLAARRAWSRRLRGDLDHITLTALRKEPERRYGSAALLAADVESYLRGLPVSATPDSLRYRAGKFVRRHRLAVAAAAAAVLGLCALTAVALWQARQAAEQARMARVEQSKAEAVSTFMQEILSAADTSAAFQGRKSGSDVTVADVLADAAAKAGRQFGGRPELEARARLAIGQSELSLGLYQAALEQLTIAAEKAISSHPEAHIDRAAALHFLARAQYLLGMTAQAEASYRRAIREYDRLPDPAAARQAPMAALHDLAVLLSDSGRFAAAEVMERRAVADLRARIGESNPAYPIMVGQLAGIRANRGDLADSERLYRQSLAAFAALPMSTAASPERGWSLTGLCNVERVLGRVAAAEAICEEARALFERTLGVHHPTYAGLLIQIGALAHQQGQDERAEKLLRASLDVLRKTLPPGHLALARACTMLGQVVTARGRPQEGEAMLRQALAIRRHNCPAGDWRIGETASALGEALLRQGRQSEARPLLQEGFETLRAALGGSYPLTLLAQRRLGAGATGGSLRPMRVTTLRLRALQGKS
jgi:serine/threonine protein kinase